MVLERTPQPRDDWHQEIERHADDVASFLRGELSPLQLKARRVPRGLYEQRTHGTFMARIRLPAGRITAVQARILSQLALQYGHPILHLTTRQDIQIHDVALEATPRLFRALLEVGLSTRGGGGNTVRNICVCPFAGICPAEPFDVTPFARGVSDFLLSLPGSFNLPRKFKVAFSGCGADCARTCVQDLGFLAELREGRPGFQVWAGGGMGAESRLSDRIRDWVPAGDVIRVAEAMRRLFDAIGDRHQRHKARFRFAVERLGRDEFFARFEKTLRTVSGGDVPLCEEEGLVVENPHPAPAAGEALFVEMEGLEVFPQRQAGYVAVRLGIPLGQMPASTLDTLADWAERFSLERVLRVMQDQTMLLPFVNQKDLPELQKEIEHHPGLIPPPWTFLSRFVACRGADTCRLGLCLSQRAARAAAEALENIPLRPETLRAVRIHISGCPNACGQHPIAPIGLCGGVQRVGGKLCPVYRVLVGGRADHPARRFGSIVGSVPARALPAFLSALLEDFQRHRLPEERFESYVERRGVEPFRERVAVYAPIPAFEDNPHYYRDWGQETEFSLAGRGAGECGAGVFELIGEEIRTAEQALQEAGRVELPTESYFQAVLAAARALLVTRGVDNSDPDGIFKVFERFFVDGGLVNQSVRSLLTHARAYRHGWREALDGKGEEIRLFVREVKELFKRLDADLTFRPAEPSTPPAPPQMATEFALEVLDLRGVACPINFVKAKLKLDTMPPGSELTVVLDEGEPIQNVPASFQQEGHTVVACQPQGDGTWQVVIRKREEIL